MMPERYNDRTDDLYFPVRSYGDLADDARLKERLLRMYKECEGCAAPLPLDWPDSRCHWCWQREELNKVPDIEYRVSPTGKVIWLDEEGDPRD